MSENVTVLVSDYEYFEKALKAFHRKCHQESIIEKYCFHARWHKPSERRHQRDQIIKHNKAKGRYKRAHQAGTR